VRLASFNVENLFARAKAMNLATWAEGAAVLAAHAELNTLLQMPDYSAPGVTEQILELLDELGILRDDEGPYVRLRKIRGRLLKRSRTGDVEVVAGGRADWIGWVELKTEPVDELAMQHTAMVIRDVGADVMGVVEAESRPTLKLFTEALLARVEGTPYEQVMLVDGNDQRGIDVGILARRRYPLAEIRSHIYDTDTEGVVFSRDCCEYHFRLEGADRLVVVVTHFKSKGYSSPGDPMGAKRRTRQARRLAAIYRGLRRDGLRQIAVVGDLNDDPSSASLQPLLGDTNLRDISEQPGFEWGGRKGTFGSGDEKEKIDYVLLSPELFRRATGGAVFRKGIWRGPRTRNPWPIYETLTAPVHAASDHAAVYADIEL
jgi:endonuclease/exonuclease/phosphatase family metal-dependent hydrolase